MIRSWTGAFKCALLLAAAFFCAAGGAEAAWVNSDIADFPAGAKAPAYRDDFHRAVNHDWLSKVKIRKGEASVDSFSERSDEVEAQIKKLFKDRSLNSHEAALVQKFHGMLRDWKSRDRLGIEPVMPYVKRIEDIKDMEGLTAYLTDSRVPHFGSRLFNVGVTEDNRDATNYTVEIAPTELLLADADEYRAKVLSPYAKRRKAANDEYIVKLLQKAGYDRNRAEAMNEGLFRVENKLAAQAMGLKELYSPEALAAIYNVRTKEQLARASGNFPLTAVIDSLGYGDSREFVLTEPKWLDSMNELYRPENLEDIKSYLITMTLFSTARLLDHEAYDLSVERGNAVMGSSGVIPDDKYAYKMVSAYLGEPLGRLYVGRYADPRTKVRIEEFIAKVVDYYRNMLHGESWLSESTRNKAISKLDNLTVRVSHPDKWEDFSALDFKDTKDGGNLVEAVAAIADFERLRDVKRVNTKVDKSEWPLNPQEVNACYSANDNSINIPIGILGGAFYSPKGGEEELLGGIGMIIGHEITHAFDTNGSQFDENGNFVNWWTEADRKAFDKRAKKISDYFSTLEVLPGVKADGEQVLGEAIADLGGLSCVTAIGRGVPGFDFSEFFKAYAKLWRNRKTKEAEEQRIKEDVHPLSYLRTNVNVQQIPEFYTAFGVKPGDGMYLAPEERIALW
ncbi:M13 family metallopeptidase [Cloacibacillus sp.]|uniref:M13-type metalloendopeptidase n=1 Tax=Cloacibacillus sp. TaxID=2049023 RepID=UPI0025C58DC6|nr:M13 family metallopeptidase [Cloacibacillus sp.]MCC8056648.1 M13 family metallopeptidase [Cloacibacillus sp.]